MAIDWTATSRGAAAGVVAAGVWAAQMPLDKRLFDSSYDDVELLGKAVAGDRRLWYPAGLALHLANGAAQSWGRIDAPDVPSMVATSELPCHSRSKNGSSMRAPPDRTTASFGSLPDTCARKSMR